MKKSSANIRSKANVRCNMYFFASNRIFVCESCEYFSANMKRMMQINVVCENIETCNYEANKKRLDSLRGEYKKVENEVHPTSEGR
jgi:hypothetical protein